MPRQAHGRPVTAGAYNKHRAPGPSQPRKRKPARGRGLNALEAAEEQFPDQVKVRQHRLGEVDEDDEPHTRADLDGRSAKRRKIATNTGDDETEEDGGSDLEGNEWHVGVDEDDEDSDIESDEAFGESDEERFADFTFRGSESNKPTKETRKAGNSSRFKRDSLSLDEDINDDSNVSREPSEQEDVSEDDFGDDGVDLATAWDMDDEEERLEAKRAQQKYKGQKRHVSSSPNGSESSAESVDAESSDETGTESEIELSDDDDKDASGKLRNFIEGITPVHENTRLSTKKARSARSLPDKPSQFKAGPSNISAAELMQFVKDPVQRQSLRMLTSDGKEESSNYKSGIPGKLAVPLAKRQQDRLDRAAAYDKSKETMDRWVDSVKQNRRAEHLSFPLPDPAKDSATHVKALQPMSQTVPQSDLEEKIQQIMVESGLGDENGQTAEDQERAYEELHERKMPLEEAQARRRALRAQRDLMFREEKRARRIKKIKSKAYRRVHRKEKEKIAAYERERLSAAGLLNSDDERERSERKRAEERMGARHRESKWAKGVKATGQAAWNEDARTGVSESAKRDEELRRRIEGRQVRESGDLASDDNSDDDNDTSDTDAENQKLDERLHALSKTSQQQLNSKLAGMAFMQRAEAARKAQNDEEIRQLRRSLADEGDVSSIESAEEDNLGGGRQQFGGKQRSKTTTVPAAKEKSEFEEKLSDDEHGGPENTREGDHIDTQSRVSQGTKLRSSSSVHDRRKPYPKQQSKAQTESRPTTLNAGFTNEVTPVQQRSIDDDLNDSNSQDGIPDGMDRIDALAMEIFAGDEEYETQKQFAKEKKETVEEEGDQVTDNTLPGWGNWTGAGISKREQKKSKGRFLSTVKGIAPEKRQDAKLDRVIINEKRIKKNGKYLATELPHPYESRTQYERSLRLPMGPEWSTRNHFQDAIKPRVLVKQGSIIKPVSRPTA